MKISPVYIKILKAVLLVSMLFLLWQYLKVIDPNEVIAALKKAGAGFGWVLLSTCAAYALGTWGWWYCLGKDRSHISPGRLFMIRHVCETVGLFNPASIAGGDMLKIVLLKPFAIAQQTVLTSVIISRLLMIVSQLALLLAAVSWLLLQGKLTIGFEKIAPSLVAVVAAISLLFTLLARLRKFKSWPVTTNPRLQKLTARVIDIWWEVRSFYHTYPRELALACAFFALHWIVGSLEFYIVLKLFGYPVSVVDSLLLDMGVIVVKAAGAFIPGQIGVEELGNKLMLSLIGISSIPLWVSVSALRRTRQIVWILIGAVFYFFFIHKKKIPS